MGRRPAGDRVGVSTYRLRRPTWWYEYTATDSVQSYGVANVWPCRGSVGATGPGPASSLPPTLRVLPCAEWCARTRYRRRTYDRRAMTVRRGWRDSATFEVRAATRSPGRAITNTVSHSQATRHDPARAGPNAQQRLGTTTVVGIVPGLSCRGTVRPRSPTYARADGQARLPTGCVLISQPALGPYPAWSLAEPKARPRRPRRPRPRPRPPPHPSQNNAPLVPAIPAWSCLQRRDAAGLCDPKYGQVDSAAAAAVAAAAAASVRRRFLAEAAIPKLSPCNMAMTKRKERCEPRSTGPRNPPISPNQSPKDLAQPTTTSRPVQIPQHAHRDSAHSQKRRAGRHRRPQRHDPDSISPSLAALLALTDIPPPPCPRRTRRRSSRPLTVEDVIQRQQESEKELSWTLGKSPMAVLLSPPEDLAEDLAEDELSLADSQLGSVSVSVLSSRAVSAHSIPSLGDSFATDGLSSVQTPGSPSPSSRRRSGNGRKSLDPVRSPPDAALVHPLERPPSPDEAEANALDMAGSQPSAEGRMYQALPVAPFKPLKLAFRSNLTASLRALRSAARSFSSINFSALPPDDHLTRSLLTMDPGVPYMDERRPPVIEEPPSAALRRYLNPTTSVRVESWPTPGPSHGSPAASIQMQTYKVQRSRSPPPACKTPCRASPPSPQGAPSPPSSPSLPAPPASPAGALLYPAVGMRPREMRENSDFIRIAVMEMAMRKRGKLDDQRPGRARWALPPMTMSAKPYEIGPNGVPVRWTPVSL